MLSNASITLAARQKQLLLECILRDPRQSWLQYLDSQQASRVCILLYLCNLSLTRKSMQRV
jgi:hypothetical protein